VTAPGFSTASWFHPDGLGLLAGVDLAGIFIGWMTPAAWVLFALGAVGALAAPREPGTRIALGVTVIGSAVLMLFLRPRGISNVGLPPAYWSNLSNPATLACVPLASVLVRGWHRRMSADTTESSEAGPSSA
jgi:hypothetical protein